MSRSCSIRVTMSATVSTPGENCTNPNRILSALPAALYDLGAASATAFIAASPLSNWSPIIRSMFMTRWIALATKFFSPVMVHGINNLSISDAVGIERSEAVGQSQDHIVSLEHRILDRHKLPGRA